MYFIEGFEFTLVDFKFLEFLPLPYLEDWITNLNYTSFDLVFSKLLISQSSLVNYIGGIKVLLYLAVFNLLYLLIYLIFKKRSIKIFSKLIESSFTLFHFQIYLRLLIQVYLSFHVNLFNE